jgi:hypothetical protein
MMDGQLVVEKVEKRVGSKAEKRAATTVAYLVA